MSSVSLSEAQFVGTDRLLAGIVLSVLTFWLFAQSVINVVPAMKSSLDISLETLTLAVSLSALFSGCFVVASGGLAMIRVGEKLLQRYGARLPMMSGPVFTAVGILLISCTFLDKSTYIVTVFFSNVLFGFGLGCYATPSTDTAVVNAPENKVGVASGIYKMGSSLGGAMGIAVTASLFALFLPLGMASAAQYALWFNAALCLGSMAVSALLLPRTGQS